MQRRRDVLDRLHGGGQQLRLAGTHRREGHAAVAHDHRGHSVPARRGHGRVPTDLRVQVGVQVDEPGGDQPTVRVDHPSGAARVDVADRGDAVTVDRHIGASGRCARAVDDRAAPDHQIVCHVNPRSTDRVCQLVRRGVPASRR